MSLGSDLRPVYRDQEMPAVGKVPRMQTFKQFLWERLTTKVVHTQVMKWEYFNSCSHFWNEVKFLVYLHCGIKQSCVAAFCQEYVTAYLGNSMALFRTARWHLPLGLSNSNATIREITWNCSKNCDTCFLQKFQPNLVYCLLFCAVRPCGKSPYLHWYCSHLGIN